MKSCTMEFPLSYHFFQFSFNLCYHTHKDLSTLRSIKQGVPLERVNQVSFLYTFFLLGERMDNEDERINLKWI